MNHVLMDEVDGRRRRTQRSKLAMIEAALELIGEGVLVPTAQQVTQRAEVGMRTFFRHFKDMEAFFDATNTHARGRYAVPFIGGKREGTLDERIERAIDKRGEAFESGENVIRSTEAQMWQSEVLQKQHSISTQAMMRDLEDWLPEIKRLKKPQREAVHAIGSYSMWFQLRNHQGLGKRATKNILETLLKQALK